MPSKRLKTNLAISLRAQRGLSLIELLVALGLGLFLIAGVFQVTVGSRQSFDIIQAQSTTQESGRFATRFIADTARNAGYINLGKIEEASGDDFAQALMDSVDFATSVSAYWPAEANFQEGAVVSGSDSAAGAGFSDAKPNSDLLSMRMQGDPNYALSGINISMSDCQGALLSQAQDTRTVVNYFINANNSLVCRADQVGGTTTTGDVVELVAGIEEMQVVYGVEAAGGTSFYAASAMNAIDWPQVRSVRIALLSASDNMPLDSIDHTYNLLNEERSVDGDGRVRQVFYQTIAFRN